MEGFVDLVLVCYNFFLCYYMLGFRSRGVLMSILSSKENLLHSFMFGCMEGFVDLVLVCYTFDYVVHLERIKE